MSDAALCENCGAPKNPGLVACSYCEVPYPGCPQGVDCPGCGDDNRSHLVACASCGCSLVRSCIFCGSASSITFPACGRCGEAFEGAEERKKQRDEQMRQQQMMGMAQQGISMVGQAAASPMGQRIIRDVFSELLGGKKR